jgi:tetratricopeptide (TPR) repeat protein
MQAKSMRLAAIAIAVLIVVTETAFAQGADQAAIHGKAIDNYVRTGDITGAVVPMRHWKPQDFDRAIASLAAGGDTPRMKAAAVLHLDIAVALVGLNSPIAKMHVELGDRLLNRLRDRLEDTAIKDHDAFRAIFLAVAGSAFVAVKDFMVAMPYVREAQDLAPQSAHVITVSGIAHEMDASGYNPEDWQTLRQRELSQRERIIRLGRAERAYREALRLDEHYAIASIRLGRVLHLDGKLEAARQSLARGAADAREPFEEYIAALFMGGLLQDQNDLEGARRSYERALTLVPTSQPATVALAHVELMSGRPARAHELARRFTATPDDTWWAYKDGALDLPGLFWLRARVRQ